MENVERKLQTLFGYQGFAENERLARLIADTHSRYDRRHELTEEQSQLVTAAAGIDPQVAEQQLKDILGEDQR